MIDKYSKNDNRSKMKFLKLYVFLVFATIPLVFIRGQDYLNIARVSYDFSANNSYDTGDGETDLSEFSFDLNLPIPISNNRAFLTGILYENFRTELYSDKAYSFQTINLKIGINQKLNEKWSYTYLLLPKFSSDLKKITTDDIQVGGVILFKKSITKNLNYKFGMFYNSDLFGPFFSPILGLYYQKDKWETNLILPSSGDLNYKITENGKVGLRFEGSVKSFNLNDHFEGKNHFVRRSNNEISSYLNWKWDNVNFLFQLGYSIGRSYRTYEKGDKVDLTISFITLGKYDKQLNKDFSDGLFLKASVIYQIKI